VRLNQTWVSALGDYNLEIEAETLEEMRELLTMAKKANILKLQVSLISRHVKELEHFAKIRKLKEVNEDDE
jgi:hypothetical protein